MNCIITLTTDFGLQDGYVGALKGVLLSLAPAAQLVDISHELAPQDVAGAAFVLASAAPYFPAGTVHLAVVDPGVGSERRMLAVRTERAHYVAPDNGLLSLVLQSEPALEMVALADRRYWRAGEISHTFHGRDIMGPVAAHIANGVPLAALGPSVSDPERLALAAPEVRKGQAIGGSVVYIDRFGNLITNIPATWLPEQACVWMQGRHIGPVRQGYWQAAPGEPLALVGSHGYLEVAVREGNASTALQAERGTEVVVTPER